VIEDDDGGGARAVFESAAIMDYLFEVYGNRGIRPEKGTAAWFSFNQWFNAAETLIAPFEQVSLHTADLPEALHHRDVADYFKARCLRYCDVLEGLVQHQDYVAGDLFTAADIMIGYLVLMVSRSSAIDLGAYPAIAEYEKRLLARPALQQTLALQGAGS
jgi:glutathione S-transferase